MKHKMIRQMYRDDVPDILAIEQEVYPDPWQQDMFHQEIDHNSAFVLLTSTSEIVGYICVIHAVDEIMISNIAIKRKYQNRGFGGLLLDFIIDLYKERGFEKCFLEVRKSNFRAISLYQKKGFTNIGLRKGYYTTPPEDALVMVLDLKDNQVKFI